MVRDNLPLAIDNKRLRHAADVVSLADFVLGIEQNCEVIPVFRDVRCDGGAALGILADREHHEILVALEIVVQRLHRRHFLAASAALAGNLFAVPKDSGNPSSDLEKLGDVALREAKKHNATYCDIRIVRLRDQRIGLRLSPERGTGKTLAVPNVSEDSSFGFGVRVIVNGAWGFAASPIVTPAEIARITGEAVTIAVSDAELLDASIEMATTTGIFPAPEGGACVAGLKKLLSNGFLKPEENVVVFNTGAGLKYTDVTSQAMNLSRPSVR